MSFLSDRWQYKKEKEGKTQEEEEGIAGVEERRVTYTFCIFCKARAGAEREEQSSG